MMSLFYVTGDGDTLFPLPSSPLPSMFAIGVAALPRNPPYIFVLDGLPFSLFLLDYYRVAVIVFMLGQSFLILLPPLKGLPFFCE